MILFCLNTDLDLVLHKAHFVNVLIQGMIRQLAAQDYLCVFFHGCICINLTWHLAKKTPLPPYINHILRSVTALY